MKCAQSPILKPLQAVFLLLMCALPAQGQLESSSIFIDRIDVNIVNVEVFVTDDQGRRVTGLTVDDFELLEDGRPVEISNFYSIARQDRLLNDLAKDREMLRNRGRSTPVYEKPEIPRDQQLNLLVYIDHHNLHQSNQERVLDTLEEFLEDRISQGDNLMLVGFDRRLRVIQPFTRDREAIARGLARLRKVATHAQLDDAERNRVLRAMVPTGSAAAGGAIGADNVLPGDEARAAYQLIRSYVVRVQNEMRYATGALENVTRSLAGLPGRKAVIYVSDGLPQRPGEELYQQFFDTFGAALPAGGTARLDPFVEALSESSQSLLERITRQANSHQVTLYTLDARGLDQGMLSAANPDYSSGAGGRATLDNIRLFNLQEPLLEMAAATGGRAILNTKNFDQALDDMATDYDSFYSLGYRANHGGDGRFHKIKVRVNRPGLKVRHRAGFVDKPEVERVADRTMSSLILDLEKNPLEISVDFGAPEKKGRGKYLLPVLIRIPFKTVTLLPSGDVEEGKLRIFLAVQDEQGGVSELHQIPYPLAIPRGQVEAARARDIGYSTSLKIRKGQPNIAVGVWDELSGNESFVHKRAQIGKI